MVQTPQRRLRLAVKRNGGAAEVADKIGCSRQRLYDLMDGQRPGLEIALKIRDLFGIPVEDWSREAAA